MKYQYCISHVPGKSLVIADALYISCSFFENYSKFSTAVDANVNAVINTLLSTDKMLDKVKEEQSSCVQLILQSIVKMVGQTETNSAVI